MTQINVFTEEKQTHGHREQICGCQSGGGMGRDGLRIWVSRWVLLYTEWIKTSSYRIAQAATFNIL